MQKLLSIILPIYNVEPYLERCIRSLEEQDLPIDKYEIIAINDGSPDNSRSILLHLQQEFNNLVLIEQENKGVSITRNVGINRATGKYLLFIDPDDYVFPNTLSDIISYAVTMELQILFLGYQVRNWNDLPISEINNESEQGFLFDGIRAYHLSRGNGQTDPDRSWGILYNSEYITSNSLYYTPQIPYLEDGEFLARVLCLAERCMFWGKSFYIRTTRVGSATHSNLFYLTKSEIGFRMAALILLKFQSTQQLSNRQFLFLNQPITKFTLLSLLPHCRLRSIFNFMDRIVLLRDIGIRVVPIQGCNSYYRFEGRLFNISPLLYFLHRILGAPLLKCIKLYVEPL